MLQLRVFGVACWRWSLPVRAVCGRRVWLQFGAYLVPPQKHDGGIDVDGGDVSDDLLADLKSLSLSLSQAASGTSAVSVLVVAARCCCAPLVTPEPRARRASGGGGRP